MKQLLITIAAVVLVGCGNSPEKKLIGEWKGTDGTGKTASLVFNEDGSMMMIDGNTVTEAAGDIESVTWRLDASQDPMLLDIVLTPKSQEQKPIILPLIARFIGDNKLQVRISRHGNSRPLSFTNEKDKNQIVLVRQ